jgi:hypothetical protein
MLSLFHELMSAVYKYTIYIIHVPNTTAHVLVFYVPTAIVRLPDPTFWLTSYCMIVQSGRAIDSMFMPSSSITSMRTLTVIPHSDTIAILGKCIHECSLCIGVVFVLFLCVGNCDRDRHSVALQLRISSSDCKLIVEVIATLCHWWVIKLVQDLHLFL